MVKPTAIPTCLFLPLSLGAGEGGVGEGEVKEGASDVGAVAVEKASAAEVVDGAAVLPGMEDVLTVVLARGVDMLARVVENEAVPNRASEDAWLLSRG